jgi:hypothetical protein
MWLLLRGRKTQILPACFEKIDLELKIVISVENTQHWRSDTDEEKILNFSHLCMYKFKNKAFYKHWSHFCEICSNLPNFSINWGM